MHILFKQFLALACSSDRGSRIFCTKAVVPSASSTLRKSEAQVNGVDEINRAFVLRLQSLGIVCVFVLFFSF